MAGNMFHHGEHAPFDHAFDDGAAEIDDGRDVVAECAITDHVMGTFDGKVQHRRAIDIDPQLAKIVGDEPRVQIRGFVRNLRSDTVQRAECGGGRSRFPVRRFEARHAPAFLIDQHSCIADRRAQFADESTHLLRVNNVTPEQNESPGLRIGIESAFRLRQGCSGAAIDRPCAHE